MKMIAVTTLAAAALVAGTSTADAQWGYGYGSYGYGGYGYGSYGSYYGNGGHDFQPHWHTTQTPFGGYAWYGNGPHDHVPHQHTYSPWSYQGYNPTASGYTQSYYPRYPGYYAPW
jgi:hypothetical protein